MIRFILKRRILRSGNQFFSSDFETLDIDVPELEAILRRGGADEFSYDTTDFIGIEIKGPK